MGSSSILQEGSRELYENGVLMRLKYHHLLPKDGFFRMSNMQIISSFPERCIMSLQSFMAGFMPPPVLDTTLPIYWQPFTFEVDHAGRIVYLLFDAEACPVFVQGAYNYMMNPPEPLASWIAADKAAFAEFATKLGTPINGVMDVLLVSDALKIQKGTDKKMPQWALDGYETTFKKYGMLLKTMPHATETMIKIRGGPMLTQIVENMVAVANNGTSAKKVLLYSAHDATIASLAFALKVEDQIPEPVSYSDSIMVDLVSNGNGEPLVEVFYLDYSSFLPNSYKLKVPGCGTSCTLSTFRNAVKDMMVDDLDKLCGL